MMNSRIGLREVAARAKLSVSTVSRALRNNPKISENTRRRVRQLAESMGYRPDPVTSAFAERRWRAHPSQGGQPLAFVTSIPKGTDIRGLWGYCERSAERRGYALRHFDLSEFSSGGEMSRVLYNRGIRGVIIGRALRDAPPLDLDWDRFSVVAMAGAWRDVPCPFHGVNTDMFANVQVAYTEVWKLGYRRIGLAPFRHVMPVSDDAVRLGACQYMLHHSGMKSRVLPFCLAAPGEGGREDFLKWYRKHKPDAVISLISLPFFWLQEAGYRIPADVGFACLLLRRTGACAGCRNMNDEWAEAAIEMLDSQMRHGQRGIPPIARTVLIEPRWIPGPSLTAQKA